MRKTYGFCSVLVVLLLLLSGCNGFSTSEPAAASSLQPQNSTPGTDDAEPWVYFVPLDDVDVLGVVVDQEGKEIVRGDHLTILYDVFTGRPQSIAQRIPLEEAPPDTRPELVLWGDCESILYALDGTVLHERAPGVFMAGFGGYVVHADREIPSFDFSPKEMPQNFASALVDMNTGVTVLEDAYALTPLGSGKAAVSNAGFRVMGVIDSSLNPLAGFPMEREYYGLFEWGDNYLADAEEPDGSTTGYVLDAGFKELAAYPGQTLVQSSGLGGGCLELMALPENDNDAVFRQLVNGATGELVLDFEAAGFTHCEYYDGEVMVCGYKNEEDRYRYALATAAGEVIADGFDELKTSVLHALHADRFVGYKEGKLMIIGRDGGVLAQADNGCSGIYSFGPGNPFSAAQWRFAVQTGERDALGRTDMALYDDALNELVPAGKYIDFRPMGGFSSAPDAGHARYLAAARKGDAYQGDLLRQDIIDLDGNIIIEGLDWVYTYYSHGSRFVVVQDGASGLMDATGSWLWRSDA